CDLTVEEKIKGTMLSYGAGAAFAKTNTGFSTGGADPADVELMRKIRDEFFPGGGIKAAAKIRKAGLAFALVRAGANRIGCSTPIPILDAYSWYFDFKT